MALILRALAVCLLLGGGASAAELKVLTAGAFKPVAAALVPAFETATGHKVTLQNDIAGALARRIAGGEAFDLVILPPAALEQLAAAGKIVPGSAVPLARVAIGVAVKRGERHPDIGSVAAFKDALLAARAVAYIDPAAGGSSGIYLTGLFQKLGLADAIRPKAVLVPGGLVAERLLRGEADIAIHQISEILAVPGAELVGPIPAEVQNYTYYAAGIAQAGGNPDAVRALLGVLGGNPAAHAAVREKGMEPPPY